MSVFISYARRDEDAIRGLARDIERTRREVWIDDRLTGGQEWWDTILEEIRRCELFVATISPDSVKSRACGLELEYAVALGKSILPVMVRDVAIQLAPSVLANAQAIRYTDRTADTMLDLTNALASARPSPPLPTPLPAVPPVPITYLGTLQQQVAASSLGFHEQTALLVELRTHVQTDDARDAALQLMRDLRGRADIVESVGREIDAVLAAHPATTASGVAAGWYPDPFHRFDQRYWDGRTWTEHVLRSGQRFLDAPASVAAVGGGLTAGGGQSRTHTFTAPAAGGAATTSATGAVPAFTAGAFIGLMLATVFCGGVVGLVAGAMNLKHPARKGQSTALIAIGLGIIVVWLIAGALSSANQSNSGF